MAIRTGLSKSDKNEIRHIVEDKTERDGGSFSPSLSYVYKAHIKSKFPKRQHRDIRRFLKEEYAHALVLGGLRFDIGLFTPSGTTPGEAAAGEGGPPREGDRENREKAIREWIEYWYNEYGSWDAVWRHANSDQGRSDIGLQPPPTPQEIQGALDDIRGSVESEGERTRPEEGGGNPALAFSFGFPVFVLAALYVLPLSLAGAGGGFPLWVLALGIAGAVAALYGWRVGGGRWMSRNWRDAVGVAALVVLILDIFAVVVSLRFGPASLISVTGLFYLLTGILTAYVVSSVGFTGLLGRISRGIFGAKRNRDGEYEIFFFLTMAGLLVGGLSSLFSVFGFLLGASINPWPYIAFMVALFGPASVYHLVHGIMEKPQDEEVGGPRGAW